MSHVSHCHTDHLGLMYVHVLGGELIKYITRYVDIVVFLRNDAILKKKLHKGVSRAGPSVWDSVGLS